MEPSPRTRRGRFDAQVEMNQMASPVTRDEIAALFSRQIRNFALRDSTALAAAYAENCVIDSATFGKLFGRVAVEKSWRHLFLAFPDIALEAQDSFIEGDRVVHVGTMDGTDTGGFLGQAPTGKRFHLYLIAYYVVDEHGMIAYERRVYDIGGLLLQLGTDLGAAAETAQIYRETLE